MTDAADVINRKAALRELYRRKRCQESLHSYALNIDVPMNPNPPVRPDETLGVSAEMLMAPHLAKLCGVLQRTVTRPFGRAIIMMPPGTAKSTYAGPVTLSWCIGNDTTGIHWKKRQGRYMIVSYGDDLARLQSRRTQGVIPSSGYQEIWDTPIALDRSAEADWSLTTGDEVRAFGIRGGITGNRCNGVLIDDPVKNREEADSPQIQKKNVDEYQGSILSRLLPGAWVILILTRWAEGDLAGYILPDGYKGQSGMIKCKDGLMWEILNMPAKAERQDDPIGRKPGEYIFPEFYPAQHWQMFENAPGAAAQRDWSSLYQQRPSTAGIGKFTREMFEPYFYDPDDLPVALTKAGAGDYAVTSAGGDFTELGIGGVDWEHTLWITEWWSKQCDTGVSVDQMLEMIERQQIRIWFNEGGVIDKAMRPAFQRRQTEMMRPGQHFCLGADPERPNEPAVCHKKHDVFCDLRSLPSIKDKVAKAMNFQARAAIGKVRFPRHAPWTDQVIQQLIALGGSGHDDKADVCGLFGRGIDQLYGAKKIEVVERPVIRPFTEAWFTMTEFPDKPPLRYR